MDILTEGARKDIPESMMFADDIVGLHCGGNEVYMAEYLDIWRKSVDKSGMRVITAKTQFMDSTFEQK